MLHGARIAPVACLLSNTAHSQSAVCIIWVGLVNRGRGGGLLICEFPGIVTKNKGGGSRLLVLRGGAERAF